MLMSGFNTIFFLLFGDKFQYSLVSNSRVRINSSMISRPWLPMNIITIYDNRLDYFHTNQGRLISNTLLSQPWPRSRWLTSHCSSCMKHSSFHPEARQGCGIAAVFWIRFARFPRSQFYDQSSLVCMKIIQSIIINSEFALPDCA